MACNFSSKIILRLNNNNVNHIVLMQSFDFSEPSGLPTEVSVDAVSTTSIALSWQPPAVHDLNGVIISYEVVLRVLITD